MICPACATAADATPGGHPAETCRDHHIQPHGCPCAHGAQEATPCG